MTDRLYVFKGEIVKKIYQNKEIFIMAIALLISEIGLNSYFDTYKWGMISIRIVLGLMMVGITVVLEGRWVFQWKKGTGLYALRKSAYKIILTIIGMLILLKGSEITMNGNTIYLIIMTVIFCCSIGFYEEGLFRMVILNGTERIFNRHGMGLDKAVWVSAMLFGLAHVVQYVPSVFLNPCSVLLQMLCKILSTGSYGLLLGFIYVKTRNIWSCMIIHAVTDFIALLPDCLCVMDNSEIEYVHTDLNITLSGIVMRMAVCLIFSVPNIVISMKIWRTIKNEIEGKK